MEDFQFLRRLPAKRSNSLGETLRPSSSFMAQGYWSIMSSPLRCLFWTSTLGTTCPAVGAAGFLQVCSQTTMESSALSSALNMPSVSLSGGVTSRTCPRTCSVAQLI